MPSRRRTRPEPPPDDSSVTKYKLFASSRSSKGVKVKGKIEPKIEGRRLSTASQSSQQNKITNSQFSVVISDSGSDYESDRPLVKTKASTSQGKKAVIPDDQDDDIANDKDEEKSNSEASSSRQPKSHNRARCSRGRGGSSMQTCRQAGRNGHDFKVSSFKPLSKQAPLVKPACTNGAQTQSNKSNGSFNGKEAESSKVEGPVEAVVEAAENGKEKGKAEMFRGISDSEEDDREFHEPTSFRRSISAKSNSKSKKRSASIEIPNHDNKKRKASSDEDQEDEDNQDDDIIDSVLVQAVQSRETSSAKSEEGENHDYITRQDHDKAMQDLRQEMKQEIDKLKSILRIETKRLIRTEVKDELALQSET